MPTVLTHAAIGWGIARAARRRDPLDPLDRTRVALAAALAAIPDLDVIAFPLGIPYSHPLGHRGLSHSLCAGVALGVLAWLWLKRAARRRDVAAPDGRDLLVLALAACSHGVLDMFTDGGLGIALLGPFSNARLFWPVTPVPVSPIGVVGFVARGLPVLAWELALLCPLAVLLALTRVEGRPRLRVAGALTMALVLTSAWLTRL